MALPMLNFRTLFKEKREDSWIRALPADTFGHFWSLFWRFGGTCASMALWTRLADFRTTFRIIFGTRFADEIAEAFRLLFDLGPTTFTLLGVSGYSSIVFVVGS